MNRRTRAAATSGWILLLGATWWTLAAVDLPAGTPRWSEPDSWSAWATGSDTIDVVVAVARALGLVLTTYLLVVTLVQLLPGRRRGRARRWLQRLTPSVVVTITAGLVAAGPTVGAAEPAVEPAGSAAGRGATMELIEPSPQPTTEPNTHLPWADEVAHTSSTAPQTTAPPTTAPPTTAPPTTAPATPEPVPTNATEPVEAAAESTAVADRVTHVVQRGDHLWSIAEGAVQASSAGGAVDDATVARYWRVLIEQNRDRLVDPGDPDLIVPGQELVLPPIV